MDRLKNSQFNLVSVSASDIPPIAKQSLVFLANRYVRDGGEIEDIGQMDNLFYCQVSGGFDTFSGTIRKSQLDHTVEDTVQIVQISPEENIAGRSTISLVQSCQEYYRDKPFVSGTNTHERYRGLGLARSRLLLMGELSLRLFGLSLHSDTRFTSPHAPKMWEELVQAGFARRYGQVSPSGVRTSDRYRMERVPAVWPEAV